jgi:hypothetical protein
MQGLDTTKEQMSTIELEARRLVSAMTPEEKASFLSGGAFSASSMIAVIDLLNNRYLSGIRGLLRK